MYDGRLHSIPQEKDKGQGRDDNNNIMDGTDDASAGNLPPPGHQGGYNNHQRWEAATK